MNVADWLSEYSYFFLKLSHSRQTHIFLKHFLFLKQHFYLDEWCQLHEFLLWNLEAWIEMDIFMTIDWVWTEMGNSLKHLLKISCSCENCQRQPYRPTIDPFEGSHWLYAVSSEVFFTSWLLQSLSWQALVQNRYYNIYIYIFCDGTRWYGIPAPFSKTRILLNCLFVNRLFPVS